MYHELYETWKREFQSVKLEKLPTDFYSRAAEYMQKLKEEGRMLDKRTAKAQLLKSEVRNARRMLHELVRVRYRKLVKIVTQGEKASIETLTIEEEKLQTTILPISEAYQAFTRNLLEGHLKPVNVECKRKNVVVRFLKDVPEIIGADMNPYGPFKVEDVASLPAENATILCKQGLTETVEAN